MISIYMSRNLEEEAKWWASEGKEGTKPQGIVSITPDIYPMYTVKQLRKALNKKVAPKKEKKLFIPVHLRKDKSELNTETVPKRGTRSNKGQNYRPSEHKKSAIDLLNDRGFLTKDMKGGTGIIKLFASDFFDIDCKDIHIPVYSGGAGIRFRFKDYIELQYNIGDGGGNNGFYLVDYRVNKEYTKVSSGKSLSETIDSLLKKLNTKKFKDSILKKEISKISKNLSEFIQNVVDAVEIAAGAYQNPMAGLKGGKRKTRKRKRKRKNKTQKRKKRKTRRRKKNKNKKTRRKR